MKNLRMSKDEWGFLLLLNKLWFDDRRVTTRFVIRRLIQEFKIFCTPPPTDLAKPRRVNLFPDDEQFLKEMKGVLNLDSHSGVLRALLYCLHPSPESIYIHPADVGIEEDPLEARWMSKLIQRLSSSKSFEKAKEVWHSTKNKDRLSLPKVRLILAEEEVRREIASEQC